MRNVEHRESPRLQSAREVDPTQVSQICALLAEDPTAEEYIVEALRSRHDGVSTLLWTSRPPRTRLIFSWSPQFPASEDILSLATTHDEQIAYIVRCIRWEEIACVTAFHPIGTRWANWAVDELQAIIEQMFPHEDRIHQLPGALREHQRAPGVLRPLPLLYSYLNSHATDLAPRWSLRDDPWRMIDLPPDAQQALLLRHLTHAAKLILDDAHDFETLRVFHMDLVLARALCWCTSQQNTSAASLLRYMEELHDALSVRMRFALMVDPDDL